MINIYINTTLTENSCKTKPDENQTMNKTKTETQANQIKQI